MNFRECRFNSMFELFRCLDSDLTLQKNFLILGGVRIGYYIFRNSNVKLYGLCGCAENNIPGVFEIYDIEYSVIQPKDFFDIYESEKETNQYFYVIPVVRDILNVEDFDMEHYSMIGHSFFCVDYLDQGRIYFKTTHDTDGREAETYYLTRNLFEKLNNNKQWIPESDFVVFRISKEALKRSEKVKKLLAKSEKELLYDNIRTFLNEEQMEGDEGTFRYDGRKTYEVILKHIRGMREYLGNLKDESKRRIFLNYIYFQMVNFNKNLVAGTDGFYRTEFCSIMEKYPEFNEYVVELNQLIALWRKLGRAAALAKSMEYFKKNVNEILVQFETIWSEITEKEITLIQKLQSQVGRYMSECRSD